MDYIVRDGEAMTDEWLANIQDRLDKALASGVWEQGPNHPYVRQFLTMAPTDIKGLMAEVKRLRHAEAKQVKP